MANSLRASQTGLEVIDRARRKKGWTKTVTVAWWENALTSRATLKRFWRRAPVQKETFIQICQVVGVSRWQAIADSDPVTPAADKPHPNGGGVVRGIVPDISGFYGRTAELQQLEQWSLRENYRLIALSGGAGMGKTDLATVFLDNVQDVFAVTLRRSLSHAPTLPQLLADLLSDLPPAPAGKDLMAQFMAVLSQFRCLVILDGMEAILQQGSLSGQYQPGYEDYGGWLHRMSTDRHQSCIIVISREQLAEVITLKPVRSLVLTGLDVPAAKALLQANRLTEEFAWDALIKLYGTSPQMLTLISATIVDLFNGSVNQFLQKVGTLFVPTPVKEVFKRLFDQLSDAEKTGLRQLAIVDQPRTFDELLTLTALPKATFPEVLQSLLRRSLIERCIATDTGEVLFTLQPVIRKIIRRHLLE